MNLETLMATILDNACGADERNADGSNTYLIETHCVLFRVVARKTNGVWEILSFVKEDN
jgi:hypothetical protein